MRAVVQRVKNASVRICQPDCVKGKIGAGLLVLAAVENGEIAKTRHESYVKLYESVKDLKEWELTKGGTR